MAALGRLLSTIGWLWFGAGIVAPMFAFDRVNVFPGLILIFVGRLIRAQARRRESEEAPEPAASEQETRPLNTDRVQPSPTVGPAAEPTVRTPPILGTPTPPPPVVVQSEETETTITEKLFSKAGTAASARDDTDVIPGLEAMVEDDEENKTLSSEEMIARARQRWDRQR